MNNFNELYNPNNCIERLARWAYINEHNHARINTFQSFLNKAMNVSDSDFVLTLLIKYYERKLGLILH